MSLQDKTKKAIGYLEKPGVCGDCKHCTEEEDRMVDRSWTDYCNYSNLCKFRTTKTAACGKFEPK